MRIAICDDDKKVIEQVKEYVLHYFDNSMNKPIVRLFNNTFSLIDEFNSNLFDIIFLDIELEKSDGIDAAVDIWKTDPSVSIIFITGHKDYALRAYDAHPFGYILKPVAQEKITNVLTSLFNAKRISPENMPFFEYKTGGVTEKVVLESILYFQQVENRTFIYTKSERIEIYGSLKNAQAQLQLHNDDFYRCHKSYIINLSKVSKWKKDHCIIVRDATEVAIPIGSTQRGKFKEVYMTYVRKYRGVRFV